MPYLCYLWHITSLNFTLFGEFSAKLMNFQSFLIDDQAWIRWTRLSSSSLDDYLAHTLHGPSSINVDPGLIC